MKPTNTLKALIEIDLLKQQYKAASDQNKRSILLQIHEIQVYLTQYIYTLEVFMYTEYKKCLETINQSFQDEED